MSVRLERERPARKRLVWLLLASVVACGGAPGPDAQTATAEELAEVREELLAMYRADQEVREGFGAAAAANDTLFAKRMLQLDSAHTTRLRAIIAEHGWPGRAEVGEDGAHAAWILVQHSPDRALQRETLELLSQPAHRDEIAASELALLTDRVRTADGLPQIYGSQFDIVDGRLTLFPIEDEANVDVRRAEAGLPPMAEYIRQMEAMTGLTLQR